MTEQSNIIDIDSYPDDVQLKWYKKTFDDMVDEMRALHSIFETLYDTDDLDVGLEPLILDGLAITGEYIPDDSESA